MRDPPLPHLGERSACGGDGDADAESTRAQPVTPETVEIVCLRLSGTSKQGERHRRLILLIAHERLLIERLEGGQRGFDV